jgi:uncharacterized protein (TIGR02118 family)
MIKIAILFRRASGLTHQQCVEHWLTVHGPLVRESDCGRRYVRRYVNAEITCSLPPGAAEYDGIAEMWFDNREDFEAFFADPEYAAVLGPDAACFADMPNLRIFATEETPVL